jgi:hypothetical protein
MGQGQSVTIDAATAAQKEKVGKFALRKTEEHTLIVLNDLLNQLLSEDKNNLFNLAQILGTEDGCKKLFTVLSSTIKKEFLSLRLPDPMRSSESRMVSAIMKDQYAQLEDTPVRKATCEQLAWFIIRLVTLVASLTASVTISRDMPSILFQQAARVHVKNMNTLYKNPAIAVSGREGIRPEYISLLLQYGGLKQITVPGETTPDVRQLYYMSPNDSVVINARHSIVYMPRGTNTGVFSIAFEKRGITQQQAPPQLMYGYRPPAQAPVAPALAALMAPQAPALAAPALAAPALAAPALAAPALAAPAPPQAPALAAPGAMVRVPVPQNNARGFGNKWSTTTRPTNATRKYLGAGRRRKTMRRARRRQHGGSESTDYFIVTVRSIVGCDKTTCDSAEFVMDVAGRTYDKSEFEKYIMNPTGVGPRQTEFADRLRPLLTNLSTEKVALEDPKEEEMKFGAEYGPLFERKTETYAKFQKIIEAIEKKPEGVSPASYRAFVLASEFDGNILNTLFCSDSWAGKRTTDMVAYSLLNSLYIDRPEGVSESSTATELANKVSEFVGAKVLAPYVPTGAAVSSFENLAFLKTPPQLSAFCTKVAATAGKRGTSVPDHKRILTEAHKALRDMYDAHIKAAIDILRKVLSAKSAGYRAAPFLELDERFRTHERGALVALEEVIKEARGLISNHFLAVEKVYRGALNALVKQTVGNYVSPGNVGKNRLNTVAEELSS